MNTDLLKKIGLNENEVKTYDLLLTYVELSPLEIANKLEITRTNSYAVLKSLSKKGLLNERIKRSKLVYSASAPENLHIYAREKLKELETNVSGVELYLPQLKKRYDLVINKEGARNYTGVEGIEMVFEDVLREERNVYIIASSFEDKRKNVLQAYKDQFRRQAKRNLKSKILVPYGADFAFSFFNKMANEYKGIEVKRFPKNVFCLDAEIIIYGPNAALINKKNDFSAVQIDSKDIGQSLKVLFMSFWLSA